MEQTVYLGSNTTDVVVYTQAISSSGTHVALVVNASTSKLVFADGTVSSATPTVASLGTGKAKVTFASIANSSLSAGDTVAVRINGTADGVAFSEYMIPVFIATASSGGGGSSLTQADIRTAVGLASANLDTQLGDIPTVAEFNARTKPTADYFDHTSDQVAVSAVNDKTGYSLATAPPTAAEVYAEFTSGSNEDVFKADVSGLSTFDASTDQVVASNMRGTDGANTVAPANSDISAIKAKTDQFAFTVANQVDANALSGGLDAAGVRSAIGLSSANLDTQLGDIPTVAEFEARTLLASAYFDPSTDVVANVTNTGSVTNAVETDAASRNASKADVSGLSTFDASTDQVVASNMRGTDDALLAASAPANFGSLGINSSGHITRVTLTDTTTSNTDMVSVSGLASSSDLSTVDNVVDAIKAVTDKLDTALVIDGSVYQFTTNALENAGGTDPASIYTYFTSSGREASFQADLSSVSADISTVDNVVDAIKSTTDNFVFTVSGQVDANTITGGGTISESSIRSALGMSSADLDSQLSSLDSKSSSIKTKTDQLGFSVSGQVDANALSGTSTPAEVYDYFIDGTRENQFKDGNVQGSGAISHTITINVDGSPASGVDVWVSSDVTGVNVVAGTLYTNNSGQATFLLDAGEYYLWAQKSGINFTNPQEFTVS